MRDSKGAVVEFCNDGDVCCNITCFDHTVKAVQDLWTATVVNATKPTNGVDGIFADHAYNNPTADPESPGGSLRLCNGGGSKCHSNQGRT